MLGYHTFLLVTAVLLEDLESSPSDLLSLLLDYHTHWSTVRVTFAKSADPLTFAGAHSASYCGSLTPEKPNCQFNKIIGNLKRWNVNVYYRYMLRILEVYITYIIRKRYACTIPINKIRNNSFLFNSLLLKSIILFTNAFFIK